MQGLDLIEYIDINKRYYNDNGIKIKYVVVKHMISLVDGYRYELESDGCTTYPQAESLIYDILTKEVK